MDTHPHKIALQQIIHIGKIYHKPSQLPQESSQNGSASSTVLRGQRTSWALLFGTEKNENFQWYDLPENTYDLKRLSSSPISPSFKNPAVACCKGRTLLSAYDFRTVHCGTLYLHRKGFRDEIGTPALFWQLLLSFETSNGLFTDPQFGCPARVDSPSYEALELLKNLKKHNLSCNG